MITGTRRPLARESDECVIAVVVSDKLFEGEVEVVVESEGEVVEVADETDNVITVESEAEEGEERKWGGDDDEV